MPLRIDLHVHTCYSHDCKSSIDDILFYSKRAGLDGIAITDHDTLEGVMKIPIEKKSLLILPGIEVSTSKGHIIGLNIRKEIPPGLEPAKTISMIHRAGGIAIAAHPAGFYKGGIGLDKSIKYLDLDAIEILNSSLFPFKPLNCLGKRLSKRLLLPGTGGSDAHLAEMVGSAYTIIDSSPNAESIIQSIRAGAVSTFGHPTSLRLKLKKIVGLRDRRQNF